MAKEKSGDPGFKRSGRGFNSQNPGREKQERVTDKIELFQLTADYTAMRLIGDVTPYVTHWIKVLSKRKGITFIPPKVAVNFISELDTFDDTIEDPYMDIPNPRDTRKYYYCNAIIREIQDLEPRKAPKPTKEERKSGYKDIKSKSWTPVRVIRLPSSVVRKLAAMAQANKHKVKGKIKEFDLTDPEYGMDVMLRFDSQEQGSAMYDVSADGETGVTPLSKTEQQYLTWRLDDLMTLETPKEASVEAKRIAENAPPSDEEEEAADETEKKKKKKRKRVDDLLTRRRKAKGKGGKGKK